MSTSPDSVLPAVPQSIQSSDLLTVAEAAQFLRCKTNATIYNLTRARAGKDCLPCIRRGRSLLFLRSDLTNYLLARRTTEAPALRPRRKTTRKAGRKESDFAKAI